MLVSELLILDLFLLSWKFLFIPCTVSFLFGQEIGVANIWTFCTTFYEFWSFFVWIKLTDKASVRISVWFKSIDEPRCFSASSQSKDSFCKKEQLKVKKPKACYVDLSVSASSLVSFNCKSSMARYLALFFIFIFMTLFYPFLFQSWWGSNYIIWNLIFAR